MIVKLTNPGDSGTTVSRPFVVSAAVGIEGVQAGASSDDEGNVTFSIGPGEGAVGTVGGVDSTTVRILACTPP